jgi:DUF4097 and DUF4098 domain-containing protein YvlB
VSFEVWLPRQSNLNVEAHNGGITVDGVSGDLRMETVNGGISLDGVSGDVRGETTNGGVRATLDGDHWTGAGLDLRTTNGGVRLAIPQNYSAQLETSTVNGGLSFDFPVEVQGRIGRQLSIPLGKGGATIRATTTNGGIVIQRR